MEVSFAYATKAKLSSVPIVEGQLVYVIDDPAHYFDYGTEKRIQLTDVIDLENDADRTAISSPHNKFYFVKNDQALWRYAGGWYRLNSLDNVLMFTGQNLSEKQKEQARKNIGAAAEVHSHAISDVTNLQTELNGKAPAIHDHDDATQSKHGFLSINDKKKLDGIADSADAVSFSPALNTGTKVGTLTINGSNTDIYAPSTFVLGNTGVDANIYGQQFDDNLWFEKSFCVPCIQVDAQGRIVSAENHNIKLSPYRNLTFLRRGVIKAGRSRGDVNGDGLINNIDGMLVLQHVGGLIDLSATYGNYGLEAADANKDGSVVQNDATIILSHSVGLSDAFVLEDLTGNWSVKDGLFYQDVAINGIDVSYTAQVTFESAINYDAYVRAECLPGKIRFYMTACPVSDISFSVSFALADATDSNDGTSATGDIHVTNVQSLPYELSTTEPNKDKLWVDMNDNYQMKYFNKVTGSWQAIGYSDILTKQHYSYGDTDIGAGADLADGQIYYVYE